MFTPEQKGRALALLKELAKIDDTEAAHVSADLTLLALIADPEIEAAWEAIVKWYA